jgi:hypothetical protein
MLTHRASKLCARCVCCIGVGVDLFCEGCQVREVLQNTATRTHRLSQRTGVRKPRPCSSLRHIQEERASCRSCLPHLEHKETLSRGFRLREVTRLSTRQCTPSTETKSEKARGRLEVTAAGLKSEDEKVQLQAATRQGCTLCCVRPDKRCACSASKECALLELGGREHELARANEFQADELSSFQQLS